MPLFGRSNKSQASLLSSHEGQSGLGRSPQQSAVSPSESPVHPQAYHYPAPSTQTAYNEAPELRRQPAYLNTEEGHPAHAIARSQSHRVSSGSNVYQRPEVNVTSPSSRDPTTIYEYPPPPKEPLDPAKGEKEHKKSKRERLFGSSKYTSTAKENTVPRISAPIGPAQLGRSNSVLRKPPPTQDQQGGGLQYPQVQPPRYTSGSRESVQSVSGVSGAEELESPVNEAYYRQHLVKGEFADEASPQTPVSHQSPQYHEDTPQQFPDQQQGQQYQAFQPPPSRGSRDSYQPYQPQTDRLSLQTFDRPSSRSSFGPPSPELPVQNISDSRPSTATSHNTQSRYSAQSLPQPLQQQNNTLRGDPTNPQMRQGQQLNPHSIPPRLNTEQMDQGHDSYSSRQGAPPPPRHMSQNNEQGRSTPPPRSSTREDPSSMDYQTLLSKHEELQAKYSKVKKYYFEKDAQVAQLQNTVANQRMSMSRTTLDDNEYMSRFSRLDGAINNLSFNIRKHWKGIPPWLGPYVNKDAHTVGTKEMTAVGRACITRWVVDEILERYFHPSLEAGLSSQLKIVEKNIRRRAMMSQTVSDEHRDDLTTKLTNWRLTTLEGLEEVLTGPQATDYKSALTNGLVEKLVASLQMNLTDPPPPGLDSGVGMIIELAVSIASNLPVESRDVCIEYFMPGTPVNDTYMKVETGLTPLTNPSLPTNGNGLDEGDQASTTSTEEQSIEDSIRESAAKATAAPGQARTDSVSGLSKDKKKQSLLGSLGLNKKLAPTSDPAGARGSMSAQSKEEQEAREKAEREREREGSIRFAAFVAVEVRGKGGPGAGGASGANVLCRAPVYGYP